MRLYCTECSQQLGGPDELCRHREPVGWCCCDDVHGAQDYDDPEAVA